MSVKHKSLLPPPLHTRVMGVIRGEECGRGRWRGSETDIEWLGNKRIEADEMEVGQRERQTWTRTESIKQKK